MLHLMIQGIIWIFLVLQYIIKYGFKEKSNMWNPNTLFHTQKELFNKTNQKKKPYNNQRFFWYDKILPNWTDT
jgi:hypothetical protein